ncbi:MAG: hypothetical protein AAGD38_08535 [Acidobacteriota bacterium]
MKSNIPVGNPPIWPVAMLVAAVAPGADTTSAPGHEPLPERDGPTPWT